MNADSFPDEWHTADERDMWAEGWILDYANGDGYVGPSAIFATTAERRIDEARGPIRFGSDDEALAFVKRRAAEGAPHALKALRIVAGKVSTPIPLAADCPSGTQRTHYDEIVRCADCGEPCRKRFQTSSVCQVCEMAF